MASWSQLRGVLSVNSSIQANLSKFFFSLEKKGIKEKESLSHIKNAREMLTEWTVSGIPTWACATTTFQKILFGPLKQIGNKDLTEVYLLQGMKNFPEKVILRE